MKDEKKVEQKETVELFGGKENLDKMEPWDFISAVKEAQDEAMKEGIRANTVMINSRLAKVKPFAVMITPFLGAQVPPMICGLEAKLADDLPQEFAFAITEAPKTEREILIDDLSADRDEWKRRAEVAERNEKIKDRALKNISRKCEIMFGMFESVNDLKEMAQGRFNEELKQAEREIEEEENNGKM